MLFVEEIAQQIIQRGLAAPAPSSAVAELVVGEFVESPNTQVRLMETGGLGGGLRVHERPGAKYVLQTLQIAVRGVLYEKTRQTCQDLYVFFDGGIRNSTLSGTFYLSLDVLQPPSFLGRDESDRWFFGFNVAALKQPS